jgi:hypothetical protein
MVNTENGNRRYHRIMSEQPPAGPPAPSGAGGFPTSRGQFPGAPAGPPSWPSNPSRGQSRALTYVALTTAILATVLAIVGWFRPSPALPPTAHTSDPTYTEQQISDAKTRVCTAFETVLKGVTLQTHGQPSDDAGMRKAQAVNGQLSLAAGGWYLRDHVDPATPGELATAARKTSNILLDLGANALAGAQNADQPQAGLLGDAQSAFVQMQELCK